MTIDLTSATPAPATAPARANDPRQAALLAVFGMVVLSFIDGFVPVIARDVGLWQFHATRSAMVLACLLPAAVVLGWRVRPVSIGAVAVRSCLVAGSMLLYFAAVAVLPLAQVAAGLLTAPIFVLLISWGFFGAQIGPWRVLAVILGFGGVLLVLRPGGEGVSVLTFVPVGAGALYATAAVATRQYCASESEVTLVAGFFGAIGLCGVAGLAVLSGSDSPPAIDGFFASGWQPWTGPALFWTAAQALVSMIGIGALFRAYLLAEASHVAVFEYTFLIAAGVWGYVLWGQVPDALAVLGMVAIMAAGVVIIKRSGAA
ncbi:EamA-like transporter family protein [Litoreibacter ponti]|uniref:EamA-like transporter family protein n=1 Tax=Litoreibacter ponti TaxID=1510457 RepID=A0A2T6BEG7_9RHOB|nr:DMT family transporter [Litoreibacter ponti]PTX54453.1 EamA-like transporter family protein [Litoreibacter ponti]